MPENAKKASIHSLSTLLTDKSWIEAFLEVMNFISYSNPFSRISFKASSSATTVTSG